MVKFHSKKFRILHLFNASFYFNHQLSYTEKNACNFKYRSGNLQFSSKMLSFPWFYALTMLKYLNHKSITAIESEMFCTVFILTVLREKVPTSKKNNLVHCVITSRESQKLTHFLPPLSFPLSLSLSLCFPLFLFSCQYTEHTQVTMQKKYSSLPLDSEKELIWNIFFNGELNSVKTPGTKLIEIIIFRRQFREKIGPKITTAVCFFEWIIFWVNSTVL